MGLLGDPYDPLTAGLLGAGAVLGTPRSRGGGIGRAGLAFLEAAQQSAQHQRQVDQDRRRNELTDLERERFGFERDIFKQKQAQQAAQQQRIIAAREWVAQNKPDLLPRFDLDPEGAIKAMFPDAKDPLMKVGAGETVLNRDTMQPVFTGPKEAAPSDIARLTSEMNALPPNDPRRAIYQAAINKATTHAPAANMTVHTGQMVPMEGPDGRPVFGMPTKTGDVTVVPGLSPPGTAAKAESDNQRKQAAILRANTVIGKVDEALKNVDTTTTGIVGSQLGKIPGTPGYDLRKTVDTIKANIAFGTLQQMREASPTGGALGQVAVQELEMLQSTIASLDANQSPQQLRTGLQAIKTHFTNWKNIVEKGNAAAPQPAPAGNGARGSIMRFDAQGNPVR